jgi:superfamily II DNA/RNA helicase
VSSSFFALGVPSPIADRLAFRGITEPFPIQAAALPDALAGRDVCGKAPTGSGKTIAFGIPLVARIRNAAPRRPKGLVLVPTRELAAQVAAEITELGGRKGKGPSVLAVYGGVGFGPQISALRKGVDIVVACPGRLADLVNQQQLTLDAVELVVLDEADRMADMGFLPEVKRLLDGVRPDRQTLLFSATLDGDIDVLVQRYQRDPARHELAPNDDGAKNRHVFWKLGRDERIGVLADVVNAEWPAVVFCRTKHGADRVAKQLAKAGVSAAAIHGDRSQNQRDRALAQFTTGKVQALVATDVAARGIHVDDVAAVVHFDQPGSEKDYVHRSGRTGRAGATGLVLSLVDKEQVKASADLQRRLGFEPVLHWPDMDALRRGEHEATPLQAQPISDSRTPRRSNRPQPTARPPRQHRDGSRRTRTAGASRAGGHRGR